MIRTRFIEITVTSRNECKYILRIIAFSNHIAGSVIISEKNSIIIAAFILLMPIFHHRYYSHRRYSCMAIIRAVKFSKTGKSVGGLIIRFEPRRIFCIYESRRIKETHKPYAPTCARQGNFLFFSRCPDHRVSVSTRLIGSLY